MNVLIYFINSLFKAKYLYIFNIKQAFFNTKIGSNKHYVQIWKWYFLKI